MAWTDIAHTLIDGLAGLGSEKSKLQKAHYYVMNGAGNRFVIIDMRTRPGHLLSAANTRHIAHPSSGYGCDQLIMMEKSSKREMDVFMRIYNADGTEVSACGNATRCVAWLLMKESGKNRIVVDTHSGALVCEKGSEGGLIRVDMGPPRLTHATIPAKDGVDLNNISLEGLDYGMAVGMGNPHIVFFVPDVHSVDLGRIGPVIEHHIDIFPERVNVSVAKVIDEGHIMLRVWERGAGLTQACGTAACATLVASVRRSLSSRTVDVTLPGGVLHVEWPEGGNVFLTGPVELQSEGDIAL